MANELYQLSVEIADKLGETDNGPRTLIYKIIKVIGEESARATLEKTLEIEAQGGMYLEKYQRNRTPGGVFFYLARQILPNEKEKELFSFEFRKAKKKKKRSPNPVVEQVPQTHYPPFSWEEREEIITPLLPKTGEVNTVKVTLIGRPGKLERRQDVVITTMQHLGKSPSLPKGVPPLPPTPTFYTVYIGAKQWQRVEEAIQQPEDALIIEGICALDADLATITVHATNVTTKQLEIAKRQKQLNAIEAPKQNDSEAVVPTATPSIPTPQPVQEQKPKTAKTKPMPLLNIPEGVPMAAQVKIRELHSAAAQFRQKLIELEKKPADKRFGYDMTQKLLANTEKQLNDLLSQYTG